MFLAFKNLSMLAAIVGLAGTAQAQSFVNIKMDQYVVFAPIDLQSTYSATLKTVGNESASVGFFVINLESNPITGGFIIPSIFARDVAISQIATINSANPESYTFKMSTIGVNAKPSDKMGLLVADFSGEAELAVYPNPMMNTIVPSGSTPYDSHGSAGLEIDGLGYTPAVPEPSNSLLMALGLGAIALGAAKNGYVHRK